MSDEDDFLIKPEKGRSRGSGSLKPLSLAAQVKRATARAGFARRSTRLGGWTGRLGRDRVAALAGRPSPLSRRVMIKARVVRQRFTSAPLARNVAYLKRDGVTRDASMFDARSDQADGLRRAKSSKQACSATIASCWAGPRIPICAKQARACAVLRADAVEQIRTQFRRIRLNRHAARRRAFFLDAD